MRLAEVALYGRFFSTYLLLLLIYWAHIRVHSRLGLVVVSGSVCAPSSTTGK